MHRKLAAIALLLGLAAPGLLLAATPVNVNRADAATLAQSLDGIGPAKADAIVAWRTANGPFKSVDDLRQVKGIGEATLERNRSAILLADRAGTAPAAAKPAKSAQSTKPTKPAKPAPKHP
ncbi:MAG: helix-hairpin-helix domain-containing protein [Rhodanobacter sp.]|nr:MAG: helix-hairpin-helix domain-containing protein [Rhodanobacter sp.]TAM11059.1 MAG: helix-hairpin-helix domain-containing protein [Rhodanobacter sp.]TAM35542.1 MAG: helix-hairpin-helix domain-containing protein [Rhodanobacter sp.]